MAPPPSTFNHKVSNGTDTVTVVFNLHSIRSPNFQVLVQDSNGKFNAHTAPAPRTYLGTIQGHPGALASGLLKANGTLLCRISFESGVHWRSTGGTATVGGSTNWKPQWPTGGQLPEGGAGSRVFAAEVGVDASYQEFLAANSDVDGTVEIVEFSVMAANVAFLRDAAILHRIGKLVVRSSQETDPYVAAGGNTGLLLNEVRNQWNNVLPFDRTHHLALVARPGAAGGLAYVGTIGTQNSFSSNGADSNGDFSIIWRHEAGHNWGSSHYEGGGQPEGPTIMSGNALSRFSSSELAKVVAHRTTNASILDDLGSYSFPIPPRANMDRADFIVGNPIKLDVLANDSSSNGQALTLLSFPNQSALGSALIRSIGTGGSKRDQILYTPPAGLASGTDYFSYRIEDAEGKTATGYATLRPVFDDELAAHWPLNDGNGTIALDTTSRQNHGTISGGATWVTGHIGGAIRLNGIDGHVAVMPLDLNTNTITITGWVKRDGSQAQFAGLACTRANGTTGAGAGLNLGTSNELRYHWGVGNNPSFNFNSHLTLPDATRTFCALSVSPTKATIYMMPIEGSLEFAVATGTFFPHSFGSTFYLGYDPLSRARHFKGDMDDFRVFQRTLSDLEISSLANDGGTPWAPSPIVNGNKLVGNSFNLSWTPAPSSTSFSVYLGTNYTLVRDATTTSSEYVGSTTSATFNPGSLPVSTWFWRVDSNDGTTMIKGPVWYFNMVVEFPGLVGWWKMDEGSGKIAKDSSSSGANGTITGAIWGNDGLVFDGSGKISCGTAASLNGTTSFSVCAWVKVPTTIPGRMVILQQRGPPSDSTNGYNGQYLLRVNADGKPSLWVYGNIATQFDLAATTTIHDNLWHHVLALRDGTEGRIYIDGAISASVSGTLRSLISNIPVFMGYDARDNNQFFNGSLRDVRIYDRALSDEEIRDLIHHAPAFIADTEPMMCNV